MNEENNSSPDAGNAEDAEGTVCKTSASSRYIAAASISFIGLLTGVVYDMPASMETIIESTFEIEPYEFEYMYSAFSLPNIIMGFINGILLDRVLGLKVGTLMWTAIALTSQAMITLAAFYRLYWLMVFSRFLLGIGLASMLVAVQCFSIVWFRSGVELKIVLGLLQSLMKAGTPIVFLIEPPIYQYVESTASNQYVLGITILPVLLAMFVLIFCIFVLGEYSQRCGLDVGPKNKNQHNANNLKEVLNFPLTLWLVSIMLSLSNCTFSGFISCSQKLLSTKYNVSYTEANTITSLFIVCGLLLTPLVAIITDKIGTDICVNTTGLLIGTVSQIILFCTNWTPFLPLLLFAINFSTFNSCCWPLIAYVVKHYQLATAYGITASILYLTAAISNLITGYLLGHYGPTQTILFFLSLLISSLILSATIWILDSTGDRVLNTTQNAGQKQANLQEKPISN